MNMQVSRRSLLGAAAAFAGALTVPWSRVLAEAADATPSIPIPPPIGSAERMGRLRRAQELMRAKGIGSVLVESGPSLDYYTGVQWWRSERLTAVVIPAEGDPIIVTPFFERPSIAEMLQVPAEIRTWNEDEEPLKLVADFLRERKVVAAPIGFEETDRYWIADRLKQQLPVTPIINANPIVRAQRMIKSPAELALMQASNDIMLASLRFAGGRTKVGMTPADIDAMIAAVHKNMGSAYDGGLVLMARRRPIRTAARSRTSLPPATSSSWTAPRASTAISRTSPGHSSSARRRPSSASCGIRSIVASRSRLKPRGSVCPPALSMTLFARLTRAGVSDRVTGYRGFRTAPGTASAWRCMSRSISFTARRLRWHRACASRTSPGSMCLES